MSTNSHDTVNVAYIMGSGRSGSTVLNIALDNHPEIGAYGELNQLTSIAWQNDWLDASGQSVHEVEFWQSVRGRWQQATDSTDVQQFVALQNRFERFRYLRNLRRAQRTETADFLRYSQLTYELFKAIRDVSGKPIVVDASKNPIRGYALSLVAGLDVRLIHLTRDSRGVCWSQRKQLKRDDSKGINKDFPGIPTWKTASLWALTNLQCNWVKKQPGVAATHLNYEQFAANPTAELAKLGDFFQCDLSPLVKKIEAGEELQVGHVVAGNRVRMNRSVKIQLDEEWRNRLSQWDQNLVWFISGWLLRKYQYSK